MRARLTSNHLVGRVGELAELELAFHDAAARRPVLVLLGGESGVGKTRLLTEFERRLEPADGQGALVLRGEAVEQADGELPYAPLLSALRPLVREQHPALAALGRGSRAQLGALLPGLDDGTTASEGQQLRLFEALLELLDLLSEQQPLVLILEDMHWSDRSTRTFVQFVARSLRQERVMLVLSYRADELHRRHPLRPLLAELDRLERARRIELEPFDRAELAEALEDILGDAPSQRLIERLFARSEGNPLYTEELLAAGLDGRGAAPQSLRDAFMLRIERLSRDAQRAARAIAVGRALDEEMIAEVTGIEHDALHEALREAVSEQVLVADADGRLGFRHALLRETMYDDLLPGERSELHLALARCYEQHCSTRGLRGVQWAITIATHYAAAGDQPAALRATVKAAQEARNVHAYAEAADMAERALELWPRVADAAELVGIDHVGLLSLAASAQQRGGDPMRAEVLLLSALNEVESNADARRCSRLLTQLSRVQSRLNRGLQGVETAQRALTLLPVDEVSSERASLLSWLARMKHLRGRYRDALTDGEEALAAAVAAADRHSETEVLNTLGMTEIALGRVDEGVARLRRALEIATEDDQVNAQANAYSNLADSLNIAGRTQEALRIAKEGLAAIPMRAKRSYEWLLMTVSELSLEVGDWEAARAHLGPPASQMAGVHQIFRLSREAELALGVGDDEVAAVSLEELEPLVASSSEPQWIGTLGCLLAELRRRQYDLPGARAAIQQGLDRIELCTDDVMRVARLSAVGIRVEADIAQRGRDLREKAEERDAIARARIHMQRLRAAAAEGGPVERAWAAIGAAEFARARGRSDPRLWLQAAEAWASLGRPYHVAVARWRAAEARVEAGDRLNAAEDAREAVRLAHGMGSRWLEEEARVLAERARLDLEDVRPGPERPPDQDEDPFGLTPRERQVLALIAEGATNRQIGAALYMAEKTASVHVSRILSKLGVRSRTQAAAMAHRLHLS